jgi:signal transduction histidine kinase
MPPSTASSGSDASVAAAGIGSSLDEGFYDELIEEHRTLLIRCAWIFGALYIVWSFFDYALVRDSWNLFLRFRLVTLALTVPVVVVFTSRRFRRHVSAGFWIWFFLLGICIVMMLPFTGKAMPTYILGLCLVCWGVGVLPYWSGVWAASNVAALAIPAAIAINISDSAVGERSAMYLVLVTAVGITTVSAQFRYQLARKEYRSRKFLETEQSKTQALQIAERQRASELADALERAREVDRLKSEFFANISHELRTPLTLILSPVDELLANLPPGAARNALRVVRNNAARLLRMIDDLLDLAKLEAGGLRLRITQLNVENVAKRVLDNAAPTAKARNIELVFSSEGQSPDLFGDPHRIEIILTNLVGNAMKFTPPGGRIEVRVTHNTAGTSVEVRDTGPGISRDEQERIFDRFHQTESSERRRQGGVGIGLALARELAQLHGGSLTVESEVGEGSTFSLFLQSGKDHLHTEILERRQLQTDLHPGRRVEDQVEKPEESDPDILSCEYPASLRSAERVLLDRGRLPRILLAEDEGDLRRFIASVLEPDYRVDAAQNGAEALQLFKQNRPDLVLTDVMMPEVSGLDLTRAIKSDPSLRHIPVILLTARGENEAALEGYEAGADDFVAKPFHTKVLQARLRAHLKMRALSLQLADQARLASAGTLAAGLAHEVKNPLNAAVNAAKVLSTGGSSRVSNEKLIGLIIDALARIDGVVSALDAHARPADGDDIRPCNVRQSVESTLNLLAHKLKDRVTVHQDYGVTGDVFAPARAFNQVLLNLVDNSIRSGAENIWIEVRQQDSVTVAVSDDGPGVPPDLVHRIFDPFFTTRVEGEGTGLGLHLSRRIARECGGELRYEPRPGGGARFVMEIPAMEQAA